MLVATHDVEQARGFDRVLCLNRRQIAFGRPTCSSGEVLEATYGGAIVAVDDGAAARARHPARAPPRPRPRHDAAWQWLSAPGARPSCSTRSLEVALVGLVGGWLGCWVLLYGVSYSAESLAHGMFPGLVGAALLGLPLVAGGAAGAGVAARRHRRRRRARGIDRDTSVGVVITSAFGLGALLALCRPRRRASRTCSSAMCSRSRASDIVVTALIAVPVLALLWAAARAAARRGLRPHHRTGDRHRAAPGRARSCCCSSRPPSSSRCRRSAACSSSPCSSPRQRAHGSSPAGSCRCCGSASPWRSPAASPVSTCPTTAARRAERRLRSASCAAYVAAIAVDAGVQLD